MSTYNVSHMVHSEKMNTIHTEFYYKVAKMMEKKIDNIKYSMEVNCLSEYGIFDIEKDNESWEWIYLLEDVYNNSGFTVKSSYIPTRIWLD
jgi:hypothetical protein